MAAEKRKKLHGVEGIDIVLLLLFIAYALLIIIPFYNVLVCSFTSLKEYLTMPLLLFPKQPTLKNYQDLFANGAIWIGYRTSFTILVLGVPLNLFLTTSMAYALSRRDTPGRKGIFSIILFTMLFNGGIIPLYLVISGIGFLGAGTIIVDREQHVRGLTTTAGLWANTCIGLAIGVGFYEGAVIACALTFIIMSVFNKLEHRLRRASASVVEVYAEFRSQSGLQIYLGELAGKNMSTISIERVDPKRESSMPSCVAVQMSVRLSSRDDRRLAMQTLCQFDDLYYLEELREN